MEKLKKHKRNAKRDICFAFFILLKKKPYEEITVKEISDRAGVTRMSFYRHFKNKEDVFVYFADECFQEFVDLMHKKRSNNLEEFLTLFFQFIYGYKESLNILIDINKYSLMLVQFEKYVVYLWKKYISKDYRNPIIDRYATSFVSGGIYYATLEWFKKGCMEEPEKIAKALTELFITFKSESIR